MELASKGTLRRNSDPHPNSTTGVRIKALVIAGKRFIPMEMH